MRKYVQFTCIDSRGEGGAQFIFPVATFMAYSSSSLAMEEVHSSKSLQTSTRLHGVTRQKTVLLVLTAVTVSYLTSTSKHEAWLH